MKYWTITTQPLKEEMIKNHKYKMVTFKDFLLQNHWVIPIQLKKHFGVKEIQVLIACQTSQKWEMIIEKYIYFANYETSRETVNHTVYFWWTEILSVLTSKSELLNNFLL